MDETLAQLGLVLRRDGRRQRADAGEVLVPSVAGRESMGCHHRHLDLRDGQYPDADEARHVAGKSRETTPRSATGLELNSTVRPERSRGTFNTRNVSRLGSTRTER